MQQNIEDSEFKDALLQQSTPIQNADSQVIIRPENESTAKLDPNNNKEEVITKEEGGQEKQEGIDIKNLEKITTIKKAMTIKELIEQKESFFDPKQPFFSLEIAQKHAQASMVYKELIKNKETETNGIKLDDICPCCSQVLQQPDEKIPYWSDPTKEMAHIGPAYPLYFQFMRYSITFLGIILAISGIQSLVKNSQGTLCKKNQDDSGSGKSGCSVSFITELATTNRDIEDPDEISSILNLVVCFALIVFSLGYRVRQKQVQKSIDKSDISVQDFTIFVNRIPLDKTKKDIQDFIESRVEKVKVEKVILAFKLNHYNELNTQLSTNQPAIKKQKIFQEMAAYERKCSKELNLNESFAGGAFVSLEKEEQVIQVVQYFSRPFMRVILGKKEKNTQKLFGGQTLYVKQAPEPGDINWEKIEISTYSKLFRRAITSTLTLLMLTGSFWAIFSISNVQNNLNTSTSDKTTIQVLSVLGSLVTIGINQLFQFCIQIFADFDGYNFKTDKVISIAKKSGMVQLVNTTFVQFSVNLIQNGNNFATAGGLVNDITLLMITNSIVPAIISMLHIDFIVKYIFQQLFLWKSPLSQQQKTQMSVHKLFEKPTMDIASCFASSANSLILAAFYSYIIPLGLPFSMISLYFQFSTNKYKLLRTQTQPPPLGAELPADMIDFYYELVILAYSIGCFVFELLIYGSTLPTTITMVVVAVLWYVLPISEYIDAKLSDGSNFITEISYQEAKKKGHFSTDYDRCNPVLMQESIQHEIDNVINKENDQTKKQAFLKLFYPTSKVQHAHADEEQPIKQQQMVELKQNRPPPLPPQKENILENLPKPIQKKKLEPINKIVPV